MLKALVYAVVLAMAGSCCAPAEEQNQSKKRPKIGVALSGGSALGLAHIGVLKWFEEHRIPIDYIAGTSMGSLVGGLYATGHESQEMAEFVGKIDWNAVLTPGVEFRQLSYRRKDDAREFPSTIEFGLKHGLKLPTGLSAGQQVGLVISRFAAPYNELKGFDDLPTPFRCVATDLNKGAEVVFSSGSLVEALRSSMSLPAFFAPVQKDGMLLVDGGVLNNIPVDVVRKMGADVVIAVALDKPPEAGKYTSMLGVAGRSISVMITANERISLGKADLIIMPDLNGLSGSDYLRWQEFIERGVNGAQSKSAMLERFAVSEQEYAEILRERKAKRLPETVKPQVIEVKGDMAPNRKAALIASLGADPKDPLPQGVIENELTKVTGMGRYDSALYSYIHRDGKEGLQVIPHEKEHGPPFLKLAFLLDASRQEGFRFGVGARVNFLDFGGPASELRTELSAGQINRLGAEYYYRIKGGKWFVAPSIYYLEDSLPYYVGDEQVSNYKNSKAGGAFDLGYAFGRFQELRLGYSLNHEKVAVTSGQQAFNQISGRASDVHLHWAYEGQDSPLVPRRGIRVTTLASWMMDYPGVNKGVPLGEATFSYARPFNKKYSMIADVAGGGTSKAESLDTRFTLGGVGRLDALGRGRLYGDRYYYGGLHVLRGLASDSLSTFGRFYLFVAGESGNAWYPGKSALPRYSGSLGLMGETLLGVVYFGGGIGDQGDARFFFRLGRVF
ncbi:MAG: patatin-like phospholipase family protein [Acidobacteria bacterium]|nr:patatin-like phospholipase family protein [Acidobacteriota bacterium]